IVVISPNFLEKKWPQWELDGLVARENHDGVKVILPLWHNIGSEEIRSYSPTLTDRLGVSSSKGIDRVTAELLKAIRSDASEPSHVAAGSPGFESSRKPEANRPLRFVQNEQQSFWGPSGSGNKPGTQVAGHWHVTNTSDRNLVLLRVRLDGYSSAFSNV